MQIRKGYDFTRDMITSVEGLLIADDPQALQNQREQLSEELEELIASVSDSRLDPDMQAFDTNMKAHNGHHPNETYDRQNSHTIRRNSQLSEYSSNSSNNGSPVRINRISKDVPRRPYQPLRRMTEPSPTEEQTQAARYTAPKSSETQPDPHISEEYEAPRVLAQRASRAYRPEPQAHEPWPAARLSPNTRPESPEPWDRDEIKHMPQRDFGPSPAASHIRDGSIHDEFRRGRSPQARGGRQSRGRSRSPSPPEDYTRFRSPQRAKNSPPQTDRSTSKPNFWGQDVPSRASAKMQTRSWDLDRDEMPQRSSIMDSRASWNQEFPSNHKQLDKVRVHSAISVDKRPFLFVRNHHTQQNYSLWADSHRARRKL